MIANVQKVENIWLLWEKEISVFEKNNRIIKQVMFYYSNLRAFWVSSTEGNLWIINLLFVEAKRKIIHLSGNNSLDFDVFEAVVYASLVYVFSFFTIGTILESQLTSYKYYLHVSVQ